MMQTSSGSLLAGFRARLEPTSGRFCSVTGTHAEQLAMSRRRLAEEALDPACEIVRRGDDSDHAEYVTFARDGLRRIVAGMRQWREYRVLTGRTARRRGAAPVPQKYAAPRRNWAGL
jgi:hypothetical protein